MKTPIHVQTKDGLDFYKKVHAEYQECKDFDILNKFFVKYDPIRKSTIDELTEFLEKKEYRKAFPMNDSDDSGWSYYKTTADKYAVLSFFLKGIQNG
jgi:hypothetical protein